MGRALIDHARAGRRARARCYESARTGLGALAIALIQASALGATEQSLACSLLGLLSDFKPQHPMYPTQTITRYAPHLYPGAASEKRTSRREMLVQFPSYSRPPALAHCGAVNGPARRAQVYFQAR